ncbi:hypothetical protein [Pseudoduganella umbonata]|uniref:Uncharacterized protein n=1 Tax=Pseudoduganella umbonata TaxID=864828 RepID=A0A4P8HUK2_9BURK|nr:hypothetical protein [Pseudoduganella umbonata]MBB3223429.1 hypothetical protein [Pseudoduganella umbonata]QCP13677.1 hypothetical protein FCL38_27025 [Pseudoduganella umbonata]
MDTGIVERSVNEREGAMGLARPAAWRRPQPSAGQEAPARSAPPAPAQPPLARGLAALAPFGYDARRRERFLAAREQGCCHQCHAPLQNLLNDCPCPHWFITSASTVERIEPVLRMYAVADVLHFILQHLAADLGGRALPRSQLAVAARDGGHELAVRIGRKQWSFRTTASGAAEGRLGVALFNPRTGKHSSVELPATARDLDVMAAVTHAIGEP